MAALDLYSHCGGEGPPVTLLHGFTTHSGAWEAIQRQLERRYRVLAIDLPGHGRSPAPPPNYDFAACVDDLITHMVRAGNTTGALVGYSMGGRIALAMAVRAPDLITRLVLEGASPGIDDPTARAARRADDTALADDLEAGDLASFMDRWQSQPLFHTLRRLDAAVLARARAIRLDNDKVGLAAALRALGTGSQPSYWNALANVRTPTLLLTGEWDDKFDRIAREMHARLPASSRSVVPGAGHTTHLENPDGFLGRILPFLADTAVMAPRATGAR